MVSHLTTGHRESDRDRAEVIVGRVSCPARGSGGCTHQPDFRERPPGWNLNPPDPGPALASACALELPLPVPLSFIGVHARPAFARAARSHPEIAARERVSRGAMCPLSEPGRERF